MVEGTSCTNDVTWTDDSNGYYVGKMVLPTDMLRILSVKAGDWNRPATIISDSDDAYKYQNCKYGVRGNPERPIAAIVHPARVSNYILVKSRMLHWHSSTFRFHLSLPNRKSVCLPS